MKRYKYVCEKCGSSNVNAIAQAVWDIEEQKWMLAGDPDGNDGDFCEDCETPCTMIRVDLKGA